LEGWHYGFLTERGLTAHFQRTGNGKQLSVWVNEVVQHRLAAAAVSTDTLLVHCPPARLRWHRQYDFFKVREDIRKDDEPITQMILCDAPSYFNVYLASVCQKRTLAKYVVQSLDRIVAPDSIVTLRDGQKLKIDSFHGIFSMAT
jgi:hypothetical protein